MLAIITNVSNTDNSSAVDGLGIALWVIGVVCILGLVYYIKISFWD